MKVSGSHQETIESVSMNLLQQYEESTIARTTEELSKQGKHVINIIHGTPASFGSVRKTLTFLWEADDTDPRYIAYLSEQQRKKEEEARREYEANAPKRKNNTINKVAEEIRNLEERIAKAETEKTVDSKKIYTIRLVKEIGFIIGVLTIGFASTAIFIIIGSEWVFFRFFGIILGIFCLIGVSVRIADIKNLKKYVKEDTEQIIKDKENINQLKRAVAEKKVDLEKIKQRPFNEF